MSPTTRVPTPKLRIAQYANSEFEAIAGAILLASGLRHERAESWATGTLLAVLESPQSEWTALATQIDDDAYDSTSATLAQDAGGNLLVARLGSERISCQVFARSDADASSLIDAVRALFPESQDARGDIVRVTFWNWAGDDGVHRIARRIAVPTWSAVRENYHSSTRTDLDALGGRVPTDASGKLILWHGAPGTGKTWAIRALLSEWRNWATGHYILDPERFFGQSATYMMSVLMDHDGIAMDRDGQEDGHRWRLLIVEDAGELLGKDARLQSGQGLARLLNVCDGLVGQGLRVLILLTTNEEVGTMHPAVTRRGRCIANIRFEMLSAQESREWAAQRGLPADGERPALLADLFAADQISTRSAPSLPGFRPRSRAL
jgi:Domain of unknown function (DUF5925)/ATPase family associated with various cellular activities (AAA)